MVLILSINKGNLLVPYLKPSTWGVGLTFNLAIFTTVKDTIQNKILTPKFEPIQQSLKWLEV